MQGEKAKLSVNSGKISKNPVQMSGNQSPTSGNGSEKSKTAPLHMHMLQNAQCLFKVQTHPSLVMAIRTLPFRNRDQILEIETLARQNRINECDYPDWKGTQTLEIGTK